jgi:hypothetical protein
MSGVTGTMIGIGVASSLASAKISSNASKNAAKTQAAAGDKALAAQQAGYQQQRQDFSPYQQAGNAALGRLGQTAGTYTGGMPQPPPQMPQQPPPGGLGSLGQPSMGAPSSSMGGQPAPGPGMPPQGPQSAPGGLVRVQAPTGEMAMLPPQQAQAAVAKGAKILDGSPGAGAMIPPPAQRQA